MKHSHAIVFTAVVVSAACSTGNSPPVHTVSADPPVAVPQGTQSPWPAVAATPVTGLRTQTRPLPMDIVSMRGLRGVAISRDGSTIAYVVNVPVFDPKAKPGGPDDTKGGWKVEQQLYVVPRTGGAPVQLTFGDEQVNAPAFSPDGKSISFMRAVDHKPALHIIGLAGGEPRTVKLPDYQLQQYAWTPDGKSFVFTATKPETDDDKAATWKRGGAHQFDRDWQQAHLFVVPITGGEVRHINRGGDTIVNFVWSPDGKKIALVTSTSSDPTAAGAFHHVVVVDAGTGEVVRDVDGGDGKTPFIVGHIAWSPDAQKLAYAVSAKGGLSVIDELRVVNLAASGANLKRTNLVANMDTLVGSFTWSGDGASIVASTAVKTLSKMYRLPVAGGAAKEIALGTRVLWGFDADRTGRYIIAAVTTPDKPTTPTLIDTERGTVTTVVDLNPEVAQWSIAKTEVVTWKNKEGTTLEGVLTITHEPTAGSPPPLVVIPHGGPDASTFNGFGAWAQLLAARGYSVFEPNYRGSTSYGRAFYEANRGRFGDIEQMDIESGVDALIASGKADRNRLFVAGWSWGGYIATWLLGHSERYRAFMIGAAVVDTVVQYAASDINHAAAADWEYKGRPWQTDTFEKSNPARSLAHAKSPVLIFHGENDPRVPFVNSQILFRALVDLGVPVTFWAYPREPHGPQEPAHVLHIYETWTQFFDAQLSGSPTPTPR